MGKLDRERDPLKELDARVLRQNPDHVTGYGTETVEPTEAQLVEELIAILRPDSRPFTTEPRK